MTAGAIGVHSLNVLSHVAEAYRRVIGNVIVQILKMEEVFARETRMRHGPAILKYVQVGTNSAQWHVPLHIEIINKLHVLDHYVSMYSVFIALQTSFGIPKYV